MKEPRISRLFISMCIAVLLASYVVGLGIKKIRFAGVETEAAASPETDKPDDKSESDKDKVAADASPTSESSQERTEEPPAEPDEEVTAQPQRPGGRRMMGEGMRERFQNMSEEERQEFMARMRERGGRRGGGGAFAQLSEEDRENLRAEMEELGTRAGELSEEEMRQARNEILEKYGITPGAGRGGRRRGDGGSGGGGGTAPPKGRACFVPQTPVWVDGKLVQIAKVTAGRTIGMNSCSAFSVAQLQEHEGTFERRDIVLESGNTIGVVGAHCFMLESGKWIAVQNLTAGQRLKTLAGTVAIMSVTKRAVPYTGKVYNLKVKNSDRYFVGKDVVIVRDY
ncbi:MAG: hypothetical protein JSU69_11905 [Candidatus Zixiibacteriota bacterium]|nr:MAG: hypothetical protein JSU69_11905 [candidate division Zixibacteria bacterium]